MYSISTWVSKHDNGHFEVHLIYIIIKLFYTHLGFRYIPLSKMKPGCINQYKPILFKYNYILQLQ